MNLQLDFHQSLVHTKALRVVSVKYTWNLLTFSPFRNGSWTIEEPACSSTATLPRSLAMNVMSIDLLLAGRQNDLLQQPSSKILLRGVRHTTLHLRVETPVCKLKILAATPHVEPARNRFPKTDYFAPS